MRARITKLWQDMQSSYYFIPALMAVIAVGLAMLTSHLDKTLDVNAIKKLGWFYANKADGARAILTTIAGSMITVAGVTFSMTMVAVSTASAQYGPRLIGNFMRDRANQFTLGTFTATFTYCLLILRTTRTGDGGTGDDLIAEFVPNISLLVALLLALASVAVLIFFVHHVPETLNVGNITARVGRQLRSDIQETFPSNLGGQGLDEVVGRLPIHQKIDQGFKVRAREEGYLQALDVVTLIKVAKEHSGCIEVLKRPGDFIVAESVVAKVSENISVEDDVEKLIINSFIVGTEKTSHQNTFFLADELVEILARAMSPGVNDPFTAINCINWFHSATIAMMSGKTPSKYRLDEEGAIRVIAPHVTFEQFADVIFGQSRSYIASDRNASLAMVGVLGECVSSASSKNHENVLTGHAQKLLIACEQLMPSRVDFDEVKSAYEGEFQP